MKSFLRISILLFWLQVQSLDISAQAYCNNPLGSLSPNLTWQYISHSTLGYYTFNAVAGCTYQFTYCNSIAPSASYGGDPYLTISTLPTSGNVTQNDDFCGLGSNLSWTAPSTGTYYINVGNCCSSQCGATSFRNLGYRSTNCAGGTPSPTGITASTSTVCNGSSATLTVQGGSGTTYWFTGSCATVGQIGTGSSINVSPTVTTTYFARNFSGGVWSTTCASVTINVSTAPSNPTASGVTITCGSTATLSASGATSYVWYSDPLGNTQVGTNATYTTPSLSTTTTYYVAAGSAFTTPGTQTFTYTGAVQNWTVPAGVTQITIDAYGAQGFSGGAGVAGLGGRIQSTHTVTPGQTLGIYVGGRGTSNTGGGWNGGASTSGNYSQQGRGGGASDVRSGGTALANRIIVAGGGGGAGYNWGTAPNDNAGNGGGSTGGRNNSCPVPGAPGYGGTQVAGGLGGAYGGWANGLNGTLGDGGAGAPGTGGGGGGGGYYGGGGGSWSGGGGGSSYSAGTILQDLQGVRSGDGQVIISWTSSGCQSALVPVVVTVNPIAGPTVNSPSICPNASATLTASGSTGNYVWFSDPLGNTQVGTGASFVTPSLTTTTTYYVRGVSSTTPSTPQTFNYTGSVQTYTVPTGVTQISVDARGAGGGIYPGGVGQAGAGGRMQATISVTPGQVLNIIVGGAGQNSQYNRSGSGGGGFSGVLNGTTHLVSAGGGGGAAGNESCPVVGNGGNGGATAGTNGSCGIGGAAGVNGGFPAGGLGGTGTVSGQPGTSTGGGIGGATTADQGTGGGGGGFGATAAASQYGSCGGNSGAGGFGGGGSGGTGGCGGTQERLSGGGGGGGGYTGGGGGTSTPGCGSCGGGGGGGGSNYALGTATSVTSTAGAGAASQANGQVIITPLTATCQSALVPVTVTVNTASVAPTTITGNTNICTGASTTLTVSGGTLGTGAVANWYTNVCGGTLVGTGNSITVNPTSNTTYFVRYENICNNTSCVTATVNVSNLPTGSVTISGTSSICNGQNTTLTAAGANTYTWSNGSTNAAISVSPTTTTTYTVTATNASGCTTTASQSVNVANATTPVISGANSVCSGQSLTLTASGANTYVWSNGSTNATVSVSPTTTTTYSVTATNVSGCTATASQSVSINPAATVTVAGTTTICNGQSTTLTASGGTSFIWSNGSVSNAITVNPSSNTSYAVTATNASGCTNATTVNVTVNTAAAPTINGTTTICSGQTTSLTASGGVSYIWSTGSTSPTIFIFPSTTTAYTVTATNASGCTSTNSATINVGALPTASISGVAAICNGQSTTLTASGGNSYAWSNGSSNTSITVNPTAATTYNVTVTNASGCSATTSQLVSINTAPTAAISGTSTICSGQSTTLTATGGATYVWSNGGSLNAVSVNPTTNTNYTVTVTNAAGCTATISQTVTVNAVPSANITGNSNICQGASVSLTASGGTSYLWSTGGAVATLVTTPATSTTYSVTVTDASGCTSTTSRAVNLLTTPTASISGVAAICNGQSTTLTASGGNSFAWSNGSSNASITVNPTAATTYDVTVTNASGCSATISQLVSINTAPTAAISGTSTICSGQSTTLTATGGTTYVWSNGGSLNAVSVNPTTNTNYTVTVTNAAGCTATISQTVSVNAVPSANITGNSNICQGASVSLTASGGTSYLWSTGGAAATLVTTPATSTNYSVTVTDASGCTSTTSRAVTLFNSPTIIINGTPAVCSGQSTNLSASGASTYTWSTGATTAVISVNPTVATTYVVTATDVNGCTATQSQLINISASPTAAINGAGTICSGQPITLTASGGGTYLWSNGASLNSISVNPSSNTSYTVTVTNSSGCTATSSASVSVNALPTIGFTGINTICAGQSTTLTASGASTYLWSNGSNVPSITVGPSSSTIYSVTATNANGCTSSSSSTVNVNALPIVSISGNNAVCNGSATTLTAAGGSTYIWNNGSTSSSISVAPTADSTYVVTATNSVGCSASSAITVTVNALPNGASISGVKVICQGQSTTLFANGGSLYLWSTGATSPSINVSTAGTYTATITNSAGCSVQVSENVIVNNLPTPSIIGPFSVCSGEIANLIATGGGNYVWSNGSNNASISVIPSTATTYNVTVTNAAGCSATSGQLVNVIAKPSPQISGSTNVCLGNTTTLSAAGGNTYLWSNGSTATTISVSPTLNTNYVVTVTNSLGCSDTISRSIFVNSLPTPIISGSTVICQGQSTTLTATGGSSYLWSNGFNTASINISSGSTYNVTTTDINGCTGTNSVTLTINSVPTAGISGLTAVCQGANTTLTATGIGSYLWNTGDTSTNIVVTPSAVTTYSLTVTNSSGCSSNTSQTVFVNALPIVTIVAIDTVCSGQAVTLTASGGNTYLWNNGGTTAVYTANPTGTILYAVTATTASGCVGSATKLIVVPTPVASIIGDTAICSGQTALLSASGGVSYVWSNGAVNSTITVSSANTYNVTITDASGCTATTSHIVQVGANPNAPVVNNTSICSGNSATLGANGNGIINWYSDSTLTNLVFIGTNLVTPALTSNTNYYLNQVDAQGCISSISVLNVTVNNNPNVISTTSDTICEGNVAYLTANASSGTINWYDQSLTGSLGTGPVFVSPNLAQTTQYYVVVTDSNGCNSSPVQVIAEIIQRPNPVTNINSISYCENDSIFINVTGSGVGTIQWMDSSLAILGNYPMLGQANQRLFVGNLASGTYMYYFAESNGSCVSLPEAAYVTVNARPITPNLFNDSPVCAGEDVFIQSTTVPGATYNWTGPNGFTTTQQNFMLNQTLNSQAGIYSLIVSVNGCPSAAATTTVTINSIPVISTSITNNGPVCEGSLIEFFAPSISGVSYVWSGPSGFSSGLQNPTISQANEDDNQGFYSLFVIDSVSGCSSSISSSLLMVNRLPAAGLALNNGPVCSGDSIGLIVQSVFGGTYQWDGPNGFNSNNRIVTLYNTNTNMSGIYNVTVSVNGCSTVLSTNVLIRTLNGSGITADTSVSAGTNLTLNASGGIIYQWSPGQYLSNSNVSNPVLNVPVAGVYNYVVTITDAQGCSGTEDITVTVLPSDRMVIPDLITPNGDGMNDVWELDFLQNLTDYRVKIYSRGGILVWNTELYQNDWNGTHFQNGKILPDGTYYYLIQLSDGTEFKGPVTIKR